MLEFLAEFVDYMDKLFSGVVVSFVVAVLIVLFGFVLGKFLGSLVERLLREAEVDKIFRKVGIKISFGVVLGTVTSYFIYVAAVVMALEQFGLVKEVFGFLVVAFLVCFVLFLFFVLVDIVPNFIAGWFLHRKKVFGVGDIVRVKNFEGKVVKHGCLNVCLVTKKKDIIRFPNSLVLKSGLVIVKKFKN